MVLFHHKQVRIDTAIKQYIKVNKNTKITAFEKKKFNSLLNIKGPGLALTRPWPGVKPTEGGPALRARVRASKNGLDPALGQCTTTLSTIWTSDTSSTAQLNSNLVFMISLITTNPSMPKRKQGHNLNTWKQTVHMNLLDWTSKLPLPLVKNTSNPLFVPSFYKLYLYQLVSCNY